MADLEATRESVTDDLLSADPLISLSPERQELLRKLRESVADLDKPEDDDHYYSRWLIARKWNLEKAEKMLKNHLKFRKEFGADTIQDWTEPEVLRKCFPGGFFGEDRQGHPVWYDNFGNLDFKGLYRAVQKEDLFKLKVKHLEKSIKVVKEFSEKKGRYIGNVTSVIDMENLSFHKHYHWPSIQTFRELLSLFEANYPELTKRIIVVRAPRIFPAAYNLVKHFLNEYTRQKIIVLGSNWKEQIQKYIDPDQLPEAYGGTRCEPDPWCTDYLNPGCDVPPEYYLMNLMENSREDMQRTTVRRASEHLVHCEVEEPRSVLSWEFVTSNYDIGFGVHHVKEDDKKEEVVPLKRRNSHVIPEAGFHTCEATGIYELKFDNSYSWTRSKELFYSVKVLPPDSKVPLDDEVPGPPLDLPSSGSQEDFFASVGSIEPDLETGLTGNEVEVDGGVVGGGPVVANSIQS